MLVLLLVSMSAAAGVSLTVQADSGRVSVSPWIYGRNNNLSVDSAKPASQTDLARYREAGLRMARENGGNNSTKYNWRRHLTSAPDWYNNVYGADWDYAARTLERELPATQGMFAFQLLGWAAANSSANFGDWAYNKAAYWSGTGQNLAGGGAVNASGGGKAAQEGDATRYLEPWPADSTAGILDHWFGAAGQGLDSSRLRYWNMDNEPDGWSGTHDDVVAAQTGHVLTAEDFVQRWVAVAKAVRKKFPGVRLVGPGSMSEWQWYTWENGSVTYKKRAHCFPEYFIRRLAEVQDSTGVRMLDVYDLHLYLNLPAAAPASQVLQAHRFLYDTAYVNPNANGVKTADGGWDESLTREYIFLRVQRWIDTYFPKNNRIGIGSTESSIDSSVSNHPSSTAVFHASMLGTLADHGAELYTPWFWYPGMWEALHLFSRYGFPTRVRTISSLDSLVSGYASIATGGDSLNLVLVNRDFAAARTVAVNFAGFVPQGDATSLQLAGLVGETFVSHTQNGLQKGNVSVVGGGVSLVLPALSVTAIRIGGVGKPVLGVVRAKAAAARITLRSGFLHIEVPTEGRVRLCDARGRLLTSAAIHSGVAELAVSAFGRGLFVLEWTGGSQWLVLTGR